jgi:hypothetical protein
MSDDRINDELAEAAAQQTHSAADSLPVAYNHTAARLGSRIAQGDRLGGIFELCAELTKARSAALEGSLAGMKAARIVMVKLLPVRQAIDSLPWPKLEAAEPTIARVCKAVAELERMDCPEELYDTLVSLAASLDSWILEDGDDVNRNLAAALRRMLVAAVHAREGGVA